MILMEMFALDQKANMKGQHLLLLKVHCGIGECHIIMISDHLYDHLMIRHRHVMLTWC